MRMSRVFHMCAPVESLQKIDWFQIHPLTYSAGILDRDTTLQDHRGPYCGTNWHATATAEHSLWRCADTQRWRSTCAALYRTDRQYLSRIDRKRAWHSTERSDSSERWAQQSDYDKLCCMDQYWNWKVIMKIEFPLSIFLFPLHSHLVNCNRVNHDFASHRNSHDIHSSYTPVFEIIVWKSRVERTTSCADIIFKIC